jgi:hypothetical protein
MEQRFAAADGDNACPQVSQMVKPTNHDFGGQGLGKVVIFVAVSTREIAPADGNDVHKNRMASGE